MTRYLIETAGERRSESSVKLNIARLRLTFAQFDIQALEREHIRGYIAQRKEEGVGNATINRELQALGGAINYANIHWQWNLPNPVKGNMLKEPDGRLRWITREEANRLIDAAQLQPKAAHLAPLITLALHTGMRRGEMLGLEWSRVDLQGSLIYLESHHTKAKKRRSVALNKTAREAILAQARFRAAHCPAAPWVFCDKEGNRIASVKRSFATACRVAEIEGFRFHDLRHTCAAWLVQAGVPMAEVRDVLGHCTLAMTERYAHLAPENLRAAVAHLDRSESRFSHVTPERSREAL
ncbi:integrase [Imhoffiella purpurea]|uniref:Integrase n=2 Tax=Imhoffiella purpurea TaxID=1249627 RepID=W9VBJ4_9GAMM|nr:integrase [Imhoffiella purpurea]